MDLNTVHYLLHDLHNSILDALCKTRPSYLRALSFP